MQPGAFRKYGARRKLLRRRVACSRLARAVCATCLSSVARLWVAAGFPFPTDARRGTAESIFDVNAFGDYSDEFGGPVPVGKHRTERGIADGRRERRELVENEPCGLGRR